MIEGWWEAETNPKPARLDDLVASNRYQSSSIAYSDSRSFDDSAHQRQGLYINSYSYSHFMLIYVVLTVTGSKPHTKSSSISTESTSSAQICELTRLNILLIIVRILDIRFTRNGRSQFPKKPCSSPAISPTFPGI
jgi:hypothetical protein